MNVAPRANPIVPSEPTQSQAQSGTQTPSKAQAALDSAVNTLFLPASIPIGATAFAYAVGTYATGAGRGQDKPRGVAFAVLGATVGLVAGVIAAPFTTLVGAGQLLGAGAEAIAEAVR